MSHSTLTLGLFQNIGPWEVIIIAVIALLLFGRRLPEVGRSLGKGIVEFKKGLRDVQDSVEREVDPRTTSSYSYRPPPLGAEPRSQQPAETSSTPTEQPRP